jgi:antitoxin component HigA of HigAB toxin-antitoxin module
MNLNLITTTDDYHAALDEIELLMNAKANTPEGDRLHELVRLVEVYERATTPLPLPEHLTIPDF